MNGTNRKLLSLLLLLALAAATAACKDNREEGKEPVGQATPSTSSTTALAESPSPLAASPVKEESASATVVPPTVSPTDKQAAKGSNRKTELDEYLEQGYQVEAKHVFIHDFEGIGKLTITPVTINSVGEGLPPFYLIASMNGVEYQIMKPEGEDSYPMLSSFEAIAFADIDPHSLKSGYTDIIVIADFITGAGREGTVPFSKAFIFKNDSWGNFLEDKELEHRIAHSATTRTLTVKQVLKLAEPVDINRFRGTYTREGSSEYQAGTITIKRITDSQVSFSFDGHHVNGGEEGLKLGNVNLGNLENAEASITESGQSAIYRDEEYGYEMIFYFYSDGTFEIVEDGGPVYGHNVTAEGIYKKDR
ncbi:hypothetical protein [Gorillibacterium sp. CAU 1737]|uniref:hypothetical protein n=1 Tax=Gorillibacterium sp. CAU 1737 TaxID=3140362 RepID=UPI00326117AF